MSTDYLQPGQMMSQQLQGIVQNAAQTAIDKRTMLAMRQQQRLELQQDMENNFNVAKTLYGTNKELALEFFNKGLKHMGREVSMENFDPAFKLFEEAAALKSKGDMQGMTALLGASKELLVNVNDRARAMSMLQEGQTAIADEQARIVQDMEGKPEGVRKAESILSAAEAFRKPEFTAMNPDQKALIAPGIREQMVQLVGSDKEDDINRAVLESEAVVNGYQSKQKLYARMFRNDPKSFDQYAQHTGASMGNPKLMADARIAELLQKPARSPQEDAELSAKIDVYGADSLRALHNERSAANVKAQTLAKLEDVGTRLTALGGNLELYSDASLSSTQIDGSSKGLPDGAMTDSQAKDAALIHGTREAKRQAFVGQNKQKIEELMQTAQMADSQMMDLTRRAVSAFPAQREKIDDQIKEFKSMSKANNAMARLLGDENPYSISQREANLKFLPEYEQDDERKAIDALKARRDEDLETVNSEKARLTRREAILRTQLPAAERKAEEEERMRAAQQSVIEAQTNGQSLTKAVRDASRYFNVDAADLTKKVKEYAGGGIADAQLDLGMRVEAWSRAHGGKIPDPTTATSLLNAVQKKYGVDRKELEVVLKDPNKPLVEVSMTDKASEAAAKDFMKSSQTTYDQLKSAPILLRNIEEAKALIPQAKGFMGPGGDTLLNVAKFLNNRLNAHINTEGIKNAEELRSRIFFNIMENLKKMDAQPSEMQQRMMADALGKLETDPNALASVLDAYGEQVRNKVELFNREVEGAMKQGTKFPYNPTIQLPERRTAAGEPIIKSEEEYTRLPSGTVFVDPFGKKRKKP